MPKLLSCLLLWLVTVCAHAQVINSLSPDKAGFYGYALDTVVSMLKNEKQITKIYLTGERCALQYTPENIQGIPVEKIDFQKNASICHRWRCCLIFPAFL